MSTQVVPEGRSSLVRDPHITEHALELLSELETPKLLD